MKKRYAVTVGYRRDEHGTIHTNARSPSEACRKALAVFDRGGIETDLGDTDGSSRVLTIHDSTSNADLPIPPKYVEEAAQAELPQALTEAARRLDMPASALAKQLEAGGIADLVLALRQISAMQPAEEPEAENYTDTEEAFENGHEVASWEAGTCASKALAAIFGKNHSCLGPDTPRRRKRDEIPADHQQAAKPFRGLDRLHHPGRSPHQADPDRKRRPVRLRLA